MPKNMQVTFMNKTVELPLADPMYSTYHFQGPCIAAAPENPSVRNWVLNEAVILTCNRSFLSGRMTPDVNVVNSSWCDNPYLDRIYYPLQYTGGYINPIIRNLLDHGYYVCFCGIDDYYVKGKSWYHEKHFSHDGMICGYDREDKTYSIYAYDTNWIYQKFRTPQRCFDKGREAIQKEGGYGEIYGVRAKPEQVEFSAKTVCERLHDYLDSSFEKYPVCEEGNVYGSIVQEYLAMYIGKLCDGSIPYDRKDSRILRLLWEHKKVMLERIQKAEKVLMLGSEYSRGYKKIVSDSNALRMLYASHCIKRRDSVLPVVQKGLMRLKGDEEKVLIGFVDRLGEATEYEAVE